MKLSDRYYLEDYGLRYVHNYKVKAKCDKCGEKIVRSIKYPKSVCLKCKTERT